MPPDGPRSLYSPGREGFSPGFCSLDIAGSFDLAVELPAVQVSDNQNARFQLYSTEPFGTVKTNTEKEMATTFGERLQHYRKRAGFSLEGLAEKIGSTKSYMWELENKPNIRPSADLVYRIAKTLGTTVGVMMGEEEPDEAITTDLAEEDRVFFRNYRELKPQTKKQLADIMDILMQDDD